MKIISKDGILYSIFSILFCGVVIWKKESEFLIFFEKEIEILGGEGEKGKLNWNIGLCKSSEYGDQAVY